MTSTLPPPEPGEHSVAADEPGRPGRLDGGRLGPNYTVRRALFGGGIVALLAVAAGVGVWLTRDGRDAEDITRPSWNAVAAVQRSSGDVRVLTPEGEELARLGGAGRTSAVHPHGDRLVLVRPGHLTLLDTSGGDAEEIPVERGWSVQRLNTSRSLTLVAAPAAPGNLKIIDGTTGDVLDVGELTDQSSPLFFGDSIRSDPGGTAFAIGDGRNFQTVVVRFDSETAEFFPGVPLAVGDGLVITSINVGRSAELGMFETTGERLNTLTTERPVGGLLEGSRFIYVTAQGAILAATAEAAEAAELGTVTLPAGDEVRWAVPALDQRRLVIAGERFIAVVDTTGEVIFEATFASEQELLQPWLAWRCLPVSGDQSSYSLVDLDSGLVLADLSSGLATEVSANGCAVLLNTEGANGSPDGHVIVTAAGVTELGTNVRSVALAPDGLAAIVTTAAGRSTLFRLSAEDSEGAGSASSSQEITPPEGEPALDLVVFLNR
jgi:hypothetical protein